MSLGGGGSQQVVQSTAPWGPARDPLRQLYARSAAESKRRPPFFPGGTFAGFTPFQEAGQRKIGQYARGELGPMIEQYQQGLFGAMDAPTNIAQDPAVQAMMGAQRQEAMDVLQRNILPSIDAGAVAAGQLGGSRQGIAQGLAAGEAQKALAQGQAQTMLGAYGPAMQAATAARTLMPQALQIGMMPGQVMMDIGSQRQAMNQRRIEEAMQRYYYPRESERDRLSWLSSILGGASPYAAQTQTQPGSSPLAGALGGALTGAGMAPTIGGLFAGGGMGPSALLAAGAANPLMWPLAIGGGLLGALG